jgi:hypothetical protein
VSLTHLVAQKPDQTPVVQSIHNLSRSETELQHTVATKLYVETGRMSNQQKAEFVGNIFLYNVSGGGHDKISPKT